MTGDGVVLEMTHPTELRPCARATELSLVEISPAQAGEFANIYRRVWPDGSGRSGWTDEQWMTELHQLGMRAWLARVDGEPRHVGLAQLGWSGKGDAAFMIIGITPEHQGKGWGGDLVTRLTKILWEQPAPNGVRTDRAWLWTIPDEHPHTVPNYLARGFRFADGE